MECLSSRSRNGCIQGTSRDAFIETPRFVTESMLLTRLRELEATLDQRFESRMLVKADAVVRDLEANIEIAVAKAVAKEVSKKHSGRNDPIVRNEHLETSVANTSMSQTLHNLEDKVAELAKASALMDSKIAAGVAQEVCRLGVIGFSPETPNALECGSTSHTQIKADSAFINVGGDVRDEEQRVDNSGKALRIWQSLVLGASSDLKADQSFNAGDVSRATPALRICQSLNLGASSDLQADQSFNADDITRATSALFEHIDEHPSIAKLHESDVDLHKRINEIKEAHKEIEKTHIDLRSLLATLPEKFVQLEHQFTIDDAKVAHTGSDGSSEFDFELDCNYDRDFEESIWDGLNFCGLPAIGGAHSFFIIIGAIATICAQGAFIASILKGGTDSSAFLADQYPGLSDIKTWRLNSGHSIEMIDSLDGTTLVRRVCDEDATAPYSGTYQTLRNDLNSYLSDNIGVYLSIISLFVWSLTVIDNFNPVLSGLLSAVYIKKDDHTLIGKARLKEYRFRIVSFTKRRAFMMGVFHAIRGAVVVITGVTGGMWLANTKNLSNLILNASALNLIFAVDELAYVVFLPKKLQCFIENAEPLKLPNKAIGGAVYTIWNMSLCFGFTLLFLFVVVLPDHQVLQQKEDALCAGNLDFVYTRHAPTNTFYASSTSSRGSRSRLAKVVDESLTFLMANDQKQNLHSNTIAITPNHGKVTLVHSQTTQSYVQGYMYYNPFCEDTTVDNFQTYTIREWIGASPSSTCQDWQHWCSTPELKLLRLLCPVTCGCADPRSGLMYRVQSEGCAVSLCEETDIYKERLDSLECRDPSAAELLAMPQWSLYFEHLTNFTWLDKRPQVVGVVQQMLEHGCDGIALAKRSALHLNFCEPSEATATRPGMAALRAFCPIACGCKTKHPWKAYDCPRKCFNANTTSFEALYRHESNTSV